MNIILLGPPGIGKGTQADTLAAKLRIHKICTGDIMREEAKKGSLLGKKVKAYMDRGELVPDAIVISIMKKRLSRNDCKRGFILDGIPRTTAQAKALEKTARIDLVINLTAPENEIIERITGRLTCRYCGEIYHVKFARPKKHGACDKCSGELYRREDQKEAIVKKRLEEYDKKTRPLIEYYRKKKLLFNVDASGSKDGVAKRIWKVIDAFTKKSIKKRGREL